MQQYTPSKAKHEHSPKQMACRKLNGLYNIDNNTIVLCQCLKIFHEIAGTYINEDIEHCKNGLVDRPNNIFKGRSK